MIWARSASSGVTLAKPANNQERQENGLDMGRVPLSVVDVVSILAMVQIAVNDYTLCSHYLRFFYNFNVRGGCSLKYAIKFERCGSS